ncbi:CPBP family intramembrane glutamic endopeptidase [Paraburkholderia phosphatilytica]|uniref:CPBP family intramembrane glutamic endopeptidase n=1 Tax=Paraburkholderia phosphatilytica TaxID=2282883 RepID=UPI000E49691E|nr:type II CAAX endopeptidase family protein [Paraburkholderia phosphatilytica]
MFTRFLITLLIATSAIATALPSKAIASNAPALSIDDMHKPDQAAERVVNQEKSDYQQVLDQYRRAQHDHPKDASLALAQCRFISTFAWSEDLSWSDVAGKDLDACSTALGKQFPDDADVALYMLDRHFGAEAVAYGEPLVARSQNWSVAQRAHLHATLSRAYLGVKNTTRSGQEAVLAVQLDPGNERLNDAMRYLAQTGRAQDAVKLLRAAPLPKLLWQETTRITTAVAVLPGTAASDELHRAQHAGIKIDAYTVARVLQRAGDSAGAQAALAADKAQRKFESPQNQQLRLDVAFDAGNAKAAADVILEQFQKTRNGAPLASAYAHLINLDPAVAVRLDLLPLAGSLLTLLALYAAAPGVLLFPAHYRGTVRQRIGKESTPLFERIGLRHAWYALAVLFMGLYFITMLRQGTAVVSMTGSGVTRIDASTRIAISYLWTLLFCAIGLLAVARLLSWDEWIGSERVKFSWVLVSLAPFCVNLLTCLANHHVEPQGTAPVAWAVSLTHGAIAIGGVPLAVAVTCVFVPIIEELVFRGCLLGGLTRHISFGWANIVQAALFSAMHQDPRRYFYLFMMGLAAGWLAKKTKGLAMPMVLHALNNAVFVWSVVTTGA